MHVNSEATDLHWPLEMLRGDTRELQTTFNPISAYFLVCNNVHKSFFFFFFFFMKPLYKFAKSCLSVLLIYRDGVSDRRRDKTSLCFLL